MDSLYTIALEHGKYYLISTTSRKNTADIPGKYYLPDSLSLEEIVDWASTLDIDWMRLYRPLYVISKLPFVNNREKNKKIESDIIHNQILDCMAIYGVENVRCRDDPSTEDLSPQKHIDYLREICRRKSRCFNCEKRGHSLGDCVAPRRLPIKDSPFSPDLVQYKTLTANYRTLAERARGNCDACKNTGLLRSADISNGELYRSCHFCFTLEDRKKYGCTVYAEDLVWKIDNHAPF